LKVFVGRGFSHDIEPQNQSGFSRWRFNFGVHTQPVPLKIEPIISTYLSGRRRTKKHSAET
jgi:hypothetical protein